MLHYSFLCMSPCANCGSFSEYNCWTAGSITFKIWGISDIYKGLKNTIMNNFVSSTILRNKILLIQLKPSEYLSFSNYMLLEPPYPIQCLSFPYISLFFYYKWMPQFIFKYTFELCFFLILIFCIMLFLNCSSLPGLLKTVVCTLRERLVSSHKKLKTRWHSSSSQPAVKIWG